MTTIRSTDPKAAMLRDVVAHYGQEWASADELIGHGRMYDRTRTVAALVQAGMLEQGLDGAVSVYRATPAGTAWVARDQQRDSLGRRRGGPRGSPVAPEVIARARALLAERDDQGKRKHTIGEVADLIGMNRHTLSLHLNPNRRRRRQELRRKRYKGKG